MNELLYFFGDSLTSILAFIFVLSIIIFVHEFGHYIVARWCGIHSDVFSLGFGPVIWSRHSKSGTRWQIAAIPLGGYVRFRGDTDPSSLQTHTTKDDPSYFMNASLWARTLTVLAGPFSNFIFSIVIFSSLVMFWGVARDDFIVGKPFDLPNNIGEIREGDEILSINGIALADYGTIEEKTALQPHKFFTYQILRDGQSLEIQGPALFPARIDGLQPRSAAVKAGLKEGDVFLELNEQPLLHFSDIGRILRETGDRPLKALIWRNGEIIEKTLIPLRRDFPKADGGFESRFMIGISGNVFFKPLVRSAGIIEAMRLGVEQTWTIILQSIIGIKSLIVGDIERCNLQGFIGIAKTSGDFVEIGMAEFIGFIAILSTAIGLMNLFPIPVLDGGHLVLYSYEAIVRKKPSARVVQWLFLVGLGFLIALMLFALTNDIVCP